MHSLRKVILWDKISMLDLFPQFLTVICHSCKIAYIKKKITQRTQTPQNNNNQKSIKQNKKPHSKQQSIKVLYQQYKD